MSKSGSNDSPNFFFSASLALNVPVFDRDAGVPTHGRSVDETIELMDFHGIEKALVHCYNWTSDPFIDANLKLSSMIASYARLLPCWTFVPYMGGAGLGPSEFVAMIRENDVKAVRIFPSLTMVPLTLDTYGKWLIPLEEAGVLVFVEDLDLSSVQGIISVCEAFPTLKVVCWCGGSGTMRTLLPALEKCTNLFVETALIYSTGCIEEICSLFGAERLLFGTHFVRNKFEVPLSPSLPMTLLSYCNLSAREKKLIAGENLENMLAHHERIEVQFREHDSIQEKALAGKPLPETVIDAHCHYGHLPDRYLPDSMGGDEKIIQRMNDIGIDRACFFPAAALYAEPLDDGYRAMAAFRDKYPDRVIAFGCIHPYCCADMHDEVKRCVTEYGFKGIKIHPNLFRIGLNDPIWEPLWVSAAEFDIPVISHTGIYGGSLGDPGHFESIASRFPDTTFIMAHFGNTMHGVRICVELMEKFDNLYVDTSGWGASLEGLLPWAVDRIGADHILFGSDHPWIDFAFCLGTVVQCDISFEDKRKILGKNVGDLF